MLKPAAVFSDHMVLQRGLPIAVFGEADGPVRVELAGNAAEAAPRDGRFCAALPPLPAGGPHRLRVTCGDEAAVFEDVMIGEVWLCGGQSNMEFLLRDELDGPALAATGDDPLLRFYTVNQEPVVDEAMLARERQTAWKPLAPGACGDVSAVACYAGLRLRKALGVPVGMLICCIGGSEIACWIGREALSRFPEGQASLRAFEDAVAGVGDDEFRRQSAEYDARVAAWCAGADAMKAANPGVKPSEIVAQIGDYPWPPPTGRWMLRRPGGPWETMVCRVAPYTARGLLWYQGETDSGDPDRYAARFRRMIAQWREGFDNPALYVVAAQLPGFNADPANEDWPGIRRAQRQVCDSEANCALVCLLDCGESEDIHPRDKRTPGSRMADAALKGAYGIGPGADSPRLLGVERAADGLLLRFSEPLDRREADFASLEVNGAPARAKITPDGALFIAAPAPATVRYAQQNDPVPALFGESGLPAFPFEAEIG